MNNDVLNIVIARDFAKSTGGRVPMEGPNSGQEFRDNLLIPALREHPGKIFIDLDGTDGYGSSFLEESFGGLIRKGFDAEDILQRIKFKSDEDDSYVVEIIQYINEAQQRLR